MSKPISAFLFVVALALFSASCQRADSDTSGISKKSVTLSEHTNTPESLVHFDAAEQQLAEGRYIFAATHLNKGIVAFRIETGKYSGAHAIRANRAIDSLTKIRKILRRNEAVACEDLHRAILNALESEQAITLPTHPQPDPALFVPVNGN